MNVNVNSAGLTRTGGKKKHSEKIDTRALTSGAELQCAGGGGEEESKGHTILLY